MAGLPPLDWPHVPHYAVMFAIGAAVFALDRWCERRERRRQALIVRPKLASQRCRRCGGPLAEWEGEFLPGDAHFCPGGYLPRVRVLCAACGGEQVFYVSWEYRRDEGGALVLDCRLPNRDALGLSPEGRVD